MDAKLTGVPEADILANLGDWSNPGALARELNQRAGSEVWQGGVCRVATHKGREYVQPEPDVFMTGQVPAREVVAAVLQYHRDRA